MIDLFLIKVNNDTMDANWLVLKLAHLFGTKKVHLTKYSKITIYYWFGKSYF